MRLLGDITTITPSGYETWLRCPRAYLLAQLLGIPESDAGPSGDEGLFVHELLRVIEENGSASDTAHVEDVLAAHGADDDHHRALVARHARRTPARVERGAHEVALARFHRRPPPMFMATARIDAIWIHDGLLDARDYKTGGLWCERVADDPRAHVQAWVLAQAAQRRSLRLRLRYEYLASEIDEDPEAWEPEADDLDAVEAQMTDLVAELWRRDADDDWRGVHDPAVCGRCRHRSLCVDSAAAAAIAWPAVTAQEHLAASESAGGDT